MIVVIEPHNAREYSNLMDEMFRLRARVFRDRMGWDVQVTNGKERDRFDDEQPVYLIYADDEAREVKGCLRLLPTTGPTVLADFFSDTLPEAVHLTAPTIWECTRFCLDDGILSRGDREELYFTSAVLIAALGDVAIRAGIESILGNFDCHNASVVSAHWMRGRSARLHRSAMVHPIYLGLFPISEAILCKVKGRLKSAQSLMVESTQKKLLVA